MVNILCHRGFWKDSSQQNTLGAFKLALGNNFGIELDVRDNSHNLVISHDLPDENSPLLETLLAEKLHKNLLLAFNIKSDGIAFKLAELIRKFDVSNYFCFDMSIPQQLQYQKLDLIWFSRVSDHIEESIINPASRGIWLDCFQGDHWIIKDIEKLSREKPLAIVSPELHGRDHKSMWRLLKECSDNNDFYLCTDFPIEAKEFFND